MKRLYVKPPYRSQRIGLKLAVTVINAARSQGYTHMRLDILKRMTHANRLYLKLGFKTIPSYRPNPICDAICMGLDLND